MILNKNFLLPAHIMFQTFDDEAVLLDIRTQEHFSLNPIASLFIQSIQEHKSTKASIENILNEYEVTQEALETDLKHLVEELIKHKLIEVI